MSPLQDYGPKKDQKKSKSLLNSKKQGSMKSDSELYSTEEPSKKHPKKRSIRCCCLFHFPVSIVLMIVMLLCYDIYVAYTNFGLFFADGLVDSDAYKNRSESTGVTSIIKNLTFTNVYFTTFIVAIVDILFSLIGLAGVDLEIAKPFMVFTIWKTLQFLYTVITSAIIHKFLSTKEYSMPINFVTLDSNLIFLVFGLAVQFYFLIYMYLYLNFLRKSRKHRHD